VGGGYGTRFCSHGTNLIGCRSDRGTIFLSGWIFIPVQNFIKCALVQCRGTILINVRNLSRVQQFGNGHWRESGLIPNYKFVLAAGAKTVTSFLIILSVLVVRSVKITSTNFCSGHGFTVSFI
jgi:hypothetical protein